MTHAAGLVMAGLLGGALGSFINVCALRWPVGRSVLAPRSACDACLTPLQASELVPVWSWLWQRGRCRACAAKISAQHPVVELAGVAAGIAIVAHYGLTLGALHTAVLGSLLLAIALADARFYLIPDALSVGGTVLGFGLAALPGGLGLTQSAIGAGVGFAGFYLTGWLSTAWLQAKRPERLRQALTDHDAQRADPKSRRRIVRLLQPVVLMATALGIAGIASTLITRLRPDLGLVVVATSTVVAALATSAVIVAWAESFDEPTFTPELATPDLAAPDLAAPDLAAPHLADPELAAPELAALGAGDIRMMAMVGAFLGVEGVALTTLAGSVLALIAWLPLSLILRQMVPLGVFLAAGAALAAITA